MTLPRIFWLTALVLLAVSSLGNRFYYSFGISVIAASLVVLPSNQHPEHKGRNLSTGIRLLSTVLAVVAFSLEAW